MMTFGCRVKKLRLAKGWSQQELAARIDLDHTYISKIENGDAIPHDKRIRSIAKALDTDLEELMDLAGSFSIDRLMDVVHEKPFVGRLLRRVQNRQLTESQWAKLNTLIDELTTTQTGITNT